jgi:TRAP-type C4-dicarboxylate transport system permease small subunit
LGLLLAYYNYRKRIVKADKVFTGTAWGIMAGTLAVVLVGVVVVVVLAGRQQPTTITGTEVAQEIAVEAEAPVAPAPAEVAKGRQGFSIIGIIVPGAVLLFSAMITWGLYNHFSRRMNGGQT